MCVSGECTVCLCPVVVVHVVVAWCVSRVMRGWVECVVECAVDVTIIGVTWVTLSTFTHPDTALHSSALYFSVLQLLHPANAQQGVHGG